MSIRAAQVVSEAMARQDPERDAFLVATCGDDAGLLHEARLLLAARQDAARVIHPAGSDDLPTANRQAVEQAIADSILRERPGDHIGRYKLLQQIGEGGFGIVFMAEQTTPVIRRVALKIIKLGMDTKQVVARFEAERQALALMDHPNIAKVFDGGATENGRPYFVMELVRGVPITTYCDSHRLSTDDRLKLFMVVCRAVQHAHQRGVIHRDIKPTNVLVGDHDGQPVPKVIDFGIAKATSSRLTERTLFTEFRQFIGSPEYMSPEQASFNDLDIDTRTDVYSLGVLLYELLVGTTPLDSTKLRAGGYDEMRRMIRDLDPAVPSTRLGTLNDTKALAHQRHTDPEALRRDLRGDLDWIVMRCLEKDRTRRYDSPLRLAEDIQRHLTDRPVEAGPPAAAYRIGKFMRRHRGPVTAAAAFLGLLVLGVVGTIAGMVMALQARDLAIESERKRSVEAEHSERKSEFLERLLTGVDPLSSPRGEDAAQLLVDEAKAVYGDDSSAVASILATHGAVARAQGDLREAEGALRMALDRHRERLGPHHPLVASTQVALAGVLGDRRQVAEAEALLRSALATQEQSLEPSDPRVIAVVDQLRLVVMESDDGLRVSEVDALWRRSIDALSLSRGDSSRATASARCEHAVWLAKHGSRKDAIAALANAIEGSHGVLTAQDADLYAAYQALGDLQIEVGNLSAAAATLDEAVEAMRTHPDIAKANLVAGLVKLGSVKNMQGGLLGNREGEALLAEADEIAQRELPRAHPVRVRARELLINARIPRSSGPELRPMWEAWMEEFRESEPAPEKLASELVAFSGWLRRMFHDFAAAERLAREANDLSASRLESSGGIRVATTNELWQILNATKQYDEAVDVYDEFIDALVLRDGPASSQATLHRMAMACWLIDPVGRREEGFRRLRENLASVESLPPHDETRLVAEVGYANSLWNDTPRDLDELRRITASVIEHVRPQSTPGDDRITFWLDRAASIEVEARDDVAAERALRSLVESVRLASPATWGRPASVASAERRLADVLLRTNRLDEAADLARTAHGRLLEALGDVNNAELGTTEIVLGLVDAHRGHFIEGEALVVRGQRRIFDDPSAPLSMRAQCARSMADFYDLWHVADTAGGHDAKAAAWRAQASS